MNENTKKSEVKIKTNKAKKGLSKDELEKMEKSDLVEMILRLEAYNKQLKNILDKKMNTQTTGKEEKSVVKGKKTFDFSKFTKRHVMLKFLYLGWDYEGYVVQDHTNNTIEHQLFNALIRLCLIENRETSNYNRCGRTDKGVSAFEQTISIDIRSRIRVEDQLTDEAIKTELNYCSLLNKVLPRNIRAIAWCPLITPTFSARFDCQARTYKYFFPRGDLNIEKLSEACAYLVGSHDFRNLCKMDVANGVVNYNRRLDSVRVVSMRQNEQASMNPYDMFYLEIQGSAFLWHMIRCIVSILMLVGQGKESPKIIQELLDVEKNSQKPQYSLASEIPLNLFSCRFREDQQDPEEYPRNCEMLNKWIFDEESLRFVIMDMQAHWCDASVKAAMNVEMLRILTDEYRLHFPSESAIKSQMTSLNRDSIKVREYKKLMDRQKCSKLEDRIDHYKKKRKLVDKSDCDE